MRGCLSFLIFVAVLLAVAGWIALPSLAGAAVTAGLSAAGVRSTATEVQVSADPPYELLTGHADRVVIRGDDVVRDGLAAGSMAVTLGDVGLVDRTAATVDGGLDDVTLRDASGRVVVVERIDLTGAASAAEARLLISSSDARTLAATSLGGAGFGVTDIALEPPNGLSTTVLGRRVTGTLEVGADGAIHMTIPGLVTVPLVRPPDGLPIAFHSIVVGVDGSVLIGATVNVERLLGG